MTKTVSIEFLKLNLKVLNREVIGLSAKAIIKCFYSMHFFFF